MRKAKGLRYPLPLLAFCILITELVGNSRQRQRARFLRGNWEWISELAIDYGLAKNVEQSPSQATLSRFFSKADEHAIKQLYLDELRKRDHSLFKENKPGKQLIAPCGFIQYCVDGKRREGCESVATGRTEIDVTFMRADNGAVVAWGVCPDKEGEAVTARKMMAMYGADLQPGIFTFDAGITGPAFIKELVRKGHFYIAAIKGNAGQVFDIVQSPDWERSALRATVEDPIAHGRADKRTIEILRTTAFPGKHFSKYCKCGCVLRVTRESISNGKTSIETRYFIASTGLGSMLPLEFLERVRAHWLQENGLHWCKDAVLGEDDLPKQSHKSSRLLGFLKSIIVSLGYQQAKSVQKFVDLCAASPKKMVQLLLTCG